MLEVDLCLPLCPPLCMQLNSTWHMHSPTCPWGWLPSLSTNTSLSLYLSFWSSPSPACLLLLLSQQAVLFLPGPSFQAACLMTLYLRDSR